MKLNEFSGMLLLSAIILFATGAVSPALAYLDPGTGGMLLQLLLGGFAAAFVILKLYWQQFKQRVKGLFGGSRSTKSLDTDHKK